MASEQDAMGLDILDPESVIREYREKIQLVIEKESNHLRDKAERESKQVIARAKEEAEKIVALARKKANIESEEIISKAREEAEQTIEDSREQSARAIDEARKKIIQIISGVMERGATQTQIDISRAASSARNKTSDLLTQVRENVEQMINENESQVKAEFESLANLIEEVENELPSLQEPRVKEIEAEKQQATEEVSESTTPANDDEFVLIKSADEKTESVIASAENVSTTPNKETGDPRLFEGSLTLEIVSPFGQEHEGDLPELLSRTRNLKVDSAGSYTRADRRITKYNLDLGEPIPLLKILNAMPQVKNITEHQDKIEVTLK